MPGSRPAINTFQVLIARFALEIAKIPLEIHKNSLEIGKFKGEKAENVLEIAEFRVEIAEFALENGKNALEIAEFTLEIANYKSEFSILQSKNRDFWQKSLRLITSLASIASFHSDHLSKRKSDCQASELDRRKTPTKSCPSACTRSELWVVCNH